MNSVYTKGSKFIVMLDQDIVDEKELGAFTLSARAGGRAGDPYRQSFEAPESFGLMFMRRDDVAVPFFEIAGRDGAA